MRVPDPGVVGEFACRREPGPLLGSRFDQVHAERPDKQGGVPFAFGDIARELRGVHRFRC